MAKITRSLPQLEKEAQDRQMMFSASLQTLRTRLTLPGLADEAIGVLDPQRARLRTLYTSVKQHPVIAAGVVAGAAWLASLTLYNPNNGRDAPARRKRARPHAIKSTEKEQNHEIE